MQHITKKKKNGFTLVELAIVLVVIGLLVGMAIKGKTLVEAAKSKADYQKVNKLTTAVNVYYTKYGRLPGLLPDKTISPKLFYEEVIKEGLLKAADFKITSAGIAFLNIVGCEKAGTTGNLMWQIVTPTETSSLCAYNTNKSIEDMLDNENVAYAQRSPFPRYLACQLETLVDDKNIRNGDGRIVANSLSGTLDMENNYDCSRYLNDPAGISKNGPYVYRIF